MTATVETPAVTVEQQQALARLNDAIDGLRALRNLVLDRPDIAHVVSRDLADDVRAPRILHYVNEWVAGTTDIDGYVTALASAALDHGATVSREDSEKWCGIDARFGFMKLHIYTDRTDGSAS